MAWDNSNSYSNNRNQYSEQPRGFGTGSSSFKGVPLRQDNSAQGKDLSESGYNPESLPPIQKNFYVEHPEVAAMSAKEVSDFRATNEMVIKGDQVPKPITSFQQANFPETLGRKLAEQKFDKPTPIQAQGWPMALSGKNMVGIAQTGSGKTLSYLLPAFVHIASQTPLRRGDGPIALILAPTRELAVQIQEVARVYGNAVGIRNACLYGGVPKGPQVRTLRQGAELVIATPGRLLDIMAMSDPNGTPITNLNRVSFLVLDEADRMLDMGFEQPLRDIIGQIRVDRQVLMWSATWPKAVRRLSEDILGRNFIQVTIGSQDLSANRKILQEIIVCRAGDKETRLVELLQRLWEELPGEDAGKKLPLIIIFSNKKRVCDDLVYKMNADNWPAAALHGDKDQSEREQVLRAFKKGDCPIMVCTDVAARGLDIRDVRVVINYDFPMNIEDYVHRIGRTARGSDTDGRAFSLFTDDDRGLARELVDIMSEAGQTVSEELQAMAPPKRQQGGGRGGFGGGRGRGGYHRGGQSRGYSNNRFRPY